MVAAGAPSSSPIKKPSGSTAAKQAASARPGFQPSAAAQFTAIEISSGRIVRILRSLMAGDRMNGLMKPRLPSERLLTNNRTRWRDAVVQFSSIQETLETNAAEHCATVPLMSPRSYPDHTFVSRSHLQGVGT